MKDMPAFHFCPTMSLVKWEGGKEGKKRELGKGGRSDGSWRGKRRENIPLQDTRVVLPQLSRYSAQMQSGNRKRKEKNE